ncbi:MAG: DUF2029 domain-containing protein [Candidatus Eremiobacteraeota bacterium]|nr:DUF2029 domain-containing protein [Candidatus Eremiobacteraeota bacterium]
MTASKLATLVIMAVLGVAAVRDLTRLGGAAPWRNMDDFADFYCAGAALDDRASPYTYEPLHRCEHRINTGDTFRARLFRENPAVAVPAPQPAYDFAPFMLLARLPVGTARLTGAIAILSSVALCAIALAGMGIPIELALAALALSTAYVELNTGQLVPFALLALVLCGFGLSRRRDWIAGVFAALTAIEPTAGVPVVAAMLLFVPRGRAAALITILLLALAAAALVGPAHLLAYFTSVLPAHSASELHFPFQYSLTYALAYLGFSPGIARLAGILSYLALLVAGLAIAPRTCASVGKRELLVFLPALCAVIAGPFLHQEELCFALPASLTLAVVARGTAKTVASCALCILAVPWLAVWGMKQLFLACLLVCTAILLRLGVQFRISLSLLFLIAGVIYALELHPPHLPMPAGSLSRVYASDQLAQDAWRDYTEERSTRDPLWFLIKLPTWTALLATLGVAARCSRTLQPISARI